MRQILLLQGHVADRQGLLAQRQRSEAGGLALAAPHGSRFGTVDERIG